MKQFIVAIASTALLIGCNPVAQDQFAVTDVDGNGYHAVTIGSQVWMVENLKAARYNDRTPIALVTDNKIWSNLTTPGYCWLDNNSTNKDNYGALYNWYAIDTGKLAPIGWHIATDVEWIKLITYLGGEEIAGKKLKENGFEYWGGNGVTNDVYWCNGDNSSGFTARGSGGRYASGEYYQNDFKWQPWPPGGCEVRSWGSWWSSSEATDTTAWRIGMGSASCGAWKSYVQKNCGSSVRCIRD